MIRELRDEIERLRSGLSLNEIEPSKARQKLAAKEAQERHLTEEWTEKWKEAAKILDEHQALALKQTGKKIIFSLKYIDLYLNFRAKSNILIVDICILET